MITGLWKYSKNKSSNHGHKQILEIILAFPSGLTQDGKDWLEFWEVVQDLVRATKNHV